MWSGDQANANNPTSLITLFRGNPVWQIYCSASAPLRPRIHPLTGLGLVGRLGDGPRDPRRVSITVKFRRDRRLWYFEAMNQDPPFDPMEPHTPQPPGPSESLQERVERIRDRIRAQKQNGS